MKVIDLTHPMHNGMPIYPGTKEPEFKTISTIEKNGYAEKRISFSSHLGTHIDAPGHIVDGGETLDKFNADKYFGTACKIIIDPAADKKITFEYLKKHEELISGADFVLFNTGWNKHWGKEEYFGEFPTLTADAAEWLCSFPIKGIGYDVISADPCCSENLPIHKILLSHKKTIIENLNNLDRLPVNNFYFSCLPLKIEGADGSPVRAAAILFNNKV